MLQIRRECRDAMAAFISSKATLTPERLVESPLKWRGRRPRNIGMVVRNQEDDHAIQAGSPIRRVGATRRSGGTGGRAWPHIEGGLRLARRRHVPSGER